MRLFLAPEQGRSREAVLAKEKGSSPGEGEEKQPGRCRKEAARAEEKGFRGCRI